MTQRLLFPPFAAAAVLATAPLAALPALAAPVVVADIAPVHSVVARVMAGVGEPVLLLPPGASPHDHAFRPSDAEALQEAGAVIWVGEALTPWLDTPLAALSDQARVVSLISEVQMALLPSREGGNFAAHDHDGDDEDDTALDEVVTEAVDPHVWLDPVNGQIIAAATADLLADLDPANATAYLANAEAFQAEIQGLMDEILARLAPLEGQPFLVFHDAFQYFENRFHLAAAGSVASSDAERPSAARVRDVRAAVDETGAVCIFSEPQFEPALVETVAEGTALRSAVLDPIGAQLEPGPDLYPTLLRNLAAAFEECLTGAG